MGSRLMTIFWSLLVHLGFVLLAALLLYLVGRDQSAVSLMVRDRLFDRAASLDLIRADILWQAMQWLFRSAAVSWILSSLWLVAADRYMPRTPLEGTHRQGLWVGLLLLNIGFTALFCWWLLLDRGVRPLLAPSTLTLDMVIVGLAVLLAYYFATALAVKVAMRPSVPLAGFFSFLPRSKR